MTDPIPELIGTGIQSLVQNAKRLGLTWTLRRATIAPDNGGSEFVKGTYDGDSVIIGMNTLCGNVEAGERVYVLMIPPAGNFIIGFVDIPEEFHTERLRVTSDEDLSLTSTLHPVQIGSTDNQNLRLDRNEVQAVNNSAAGNLSLNADGGNVLFQANGAGTFIMRDDGDQEWSGSRRLWRGERSVFDNTNAQGPGLSLTDSPSIEVARDGVCGHFNNIATGAASQTTVSFRREGTQVGSVSVTATTTAYNTSSDYRLKEKVRGIDDEVSRGATALARVRKLRPVKFSWIKTGLEDDGFLAHEVQEIVPGAVYGEKDAVVGERGRRADGDRPGTIIPQQLDYSKLVPLLTGAIQELAARVETLEAQLAKR